MNHLPPAAPPQPGGPDDGSAGAWTALSAKIVYYARTRFGSCSFPPGTEFNDFVSDLRAKVRTSIHAFEDRGEDSFWRWVHTIGGNLWRDMWRRWDRDHRARSPGEGGLPGRSPNSDGGGPSGSVPG